jgi:hypothetical protein
MRAVVTGPFTPETPLAAHRLPVFDAPTVTLYLDQIKRFNASYEHLMLFAADMCGVPVKRLNILYLERCRATHKLPARDALVTYWQAQGSWPA